MKHRQCVSCQLDDTLVSISNLWPSLVSTSALPHGLPHPSFQSTSRGDHRLTVLPRWLRDVYRNGSCPRRKRTDGDLLVTLTGMKGVVNRVKEHCWRTMGVTDYRWNPMSPNVLTWLVKLSRYCMCQFDKSWKCIIFPSCHRMNVFFGFHWINPVWSLVPEPILSDLFMWNPPLSSESYFFHMGHSLHRVFFF